MADSSTELLIMFSCKGSITAKKIATEVIATELGSSVRIINGVNSYFRWVGKVENAEEQLLLIRTNSGVYSDLEQTIKRLHHHELPEISVVPISIGFPDI
ncbi:MAG: divalent cation tolerance protein CutA [Gammaproteobacteria bacterium]|nr:divalent cation tolerance protein CutA [Gammaproteobacteria bacterium]